MNCARLPKAVPGNLDMSDEKNLVRRALFEGGNSRLHFAWWDGSGIVGPVDVRYPGAGDGLSELVADLLKGRTPEKIAACSVSSRWREPLFMALDGLARDGLVVARTAHDVRMEVRYGRPETIGIDRVLAAYAAYRLHGDSCVVVDAGTAVTVDAVSGDGRLLGGYIFPGRELLSRALADGTSLPLVEPSDGCMEVGASTETCISRAVTAGFAGAVAGLVERASGAAGAAGRVVLTGGDAEILRNSLPREVSWRPHLVLEGLGMVMDTLPGYAV